MNTLSKIQSQLQNYLMHTNPEIIANTVSTAKVSAETRLDIYANAYRSRLREALSASYPIIEAYLGTEDFVEMCNAYLQAHPSKYRSIRWFGDELSNFLSLHTPYSDYPFISELALLEWTMALVFDGPNGPVLPLEAMGKIAPEDWVNMRLKAHPTIQRIALKWNVVQIWQAITDDETPPDPVESSEKIEWILWRQDLLSHFSSLPIDEAWAIDALREGKTFSEICEGLCQWNAEKDTGLRAASLLKGWIVSGMISSIEN